MHVDHGMYALSFSLEITVNMPFLTITTTGQWIISITIIAVAKNYFASVRRKKSLLEGHGFLMGQLFSGMISLFEICIFTHSLILFRDEILIVVA